MRNPLSGERIWLSCKVKNLNRHVDDVHIRRETLSDTGSSETVVTQWRNGKLTEMRVAGFDPPVMALEDFFQDRPPMIPMSVGASGNDDSLFS